MYFCSPDVHKCIHQSWIKNEYSKVLEVLLPISNASDTTKLPFQLNSVQVDEKSSFDTNRKLTIIGPHSSLPRHGGTSKAASRRVRLCAVCSALAPHQHPTQVSDWSVSMETAAAAPHLMDNQELPHLRGRDESSDFNFNPNLWR